MPEAILTDVLVIGAGAAAARAAIEAASHGVKVDLVDKGKFGQSGTSVPCLQGLASTINSEDSPEIFFNDWLRSSGHISDETLVWEAIAQSRYVVESLEAMGVVFLSDTDGKRLFYRGAGHSVARGMTSKFIKAEGPNTVTILQAEAEKQGVIIHESILVSRLLKNDDHIVGAIGINVKKEFTVFRAKAVILASGGANWIYPNAAAEVAKPQYHTTGDSYYLAFMAGAPLIDLEFTQFRESPPGAAKFGGRYLNSLGERFMEKYDPHNLEKAPRAKVVEAVYREIMAGRGPIKWEVGGIPKEEAANASWLADRVDKKWVPVNIDFQRVLGGVMINEKAKTPIGGLFAAGEASGGVQGAGRMQGAAFLETQAFGINAGKYAADLALNSVLMELEVNQLHDEERRITNIRGKLNPGELIKSIQQLMWEHVGVVRSKEGLNDALVKFEQIKKERIPQLSGDNIFAAIETINLLFAAKAIATAALNRQESRGAQIRSDYPNNDDDQWIKHVCITNHKGEIAVTTIPVVKR